MRSRSSRLETIICKPGGMPLGTGRNVMHGYISGADSHLTPGQPCLVIDSTGALVAHGTPITTHLEMSFLRKGVAVKVREGAMKQDP